MSSFFFVLRFTDSDYPFGFFKHGSDLTKKTLLPVSQHFVSGTHWMTLSDPKFISLTTIQVGKRIKDIKESFWIRELQTLHKQKGLNLLFLKFLTSAWSLASW
jgi:hypothetical protein